MSGSCRVRELELVGAGPKGAAESSRWVAEALRLATFPAEDLPGRLMIRRLDLAFPSERASAAHGSRVASRALGDAWSSALWFAVPGAASANAVLAPRAVDVWIEVARRLCGASALDLSAWFWPLLLGERLALGDRRGVLATCIETLLAPESGSAALPRLAAVIAALADDGTPAPLLEVLGPQHAPGLLRELAGALGGEPFAGAPPRAATDASEGPDDRSGRAERADLERLETRWRRLLKAFVPSWGAADGRSTWLCFTALWAPHPSRAALPGIEQSARRLARAVMASARAEHSSRAPSSGASSAREPARPAATHPPSPPSSSGEASPPLVTRGPSAGASGAAGSARQATTLATRQETARVGARDPNDAARAKAPAPNDAAGAGLGASGDAAREAAASDEGGLFASFGAFRPSDFAGLLFILPILARLGLAGFLTRYPALAEWDFVHRVLARFADALEVPDADPMRRVLGPLAADVSPELEGVELPEAWWRQLGQAESLELRRLGAALGRATGRDAADLVLVAWERAVMLWLATFTELGLRELVRRPGQVALTRTHVDVLFDLNQADVRVRAPALDLNPGFVSHLGRVVTFHYGDRRRS